MNSARTLGGEAGPAVGQSDRLRVVVDTNAVLDLWAFGDSRVQGLRAALQEQQLDWVGTMAMRQELETVLTRGVGARYGAHPAQVLALWDGHVRVVDLPRGVPTDHRLRCRDPDDQKFLDLGLTLCAQWLLTSDRDLLKLSRRAATLGLRVASPHGWVPEGDPPSTGDGQAAWR